VGSAQCDLGRFSGLAASEPLLSLLGVGSSSTSYLTSSGQLSVSFVSSRPCWVEVTSGNGPALLAATVGPGITAPIGVRFPSSSRSEPEARQCSFGAERVARRLRPLARRSPFMFFPVELAAALSSLRAQRQQARLESLCARITNVEVVTGDDSKGLFERAPYGATLVALGHFA